MFRTTERARCRRLLSGVVLSALVVGLLFTLVLAGCDEEDEAPSTTLATPTTIPAVQFADVPSDHVYYAQIADLAARGIVSGYADGSFGPDDWITRQQFAKLIVLAAGYPVSEDDVCPFDDVQKSGADSLYPDNYVAVAAARGITRGTTSTEFEPEENMTRAQLITMVARAAELPAPPADHELPFRDFSAAHFSWAAKAHYAGLLDGLEEFKPDYRGGIYDFWAKATRAEACVLLHGFLQLSDSGGE